MIRRQHQGFTLIEVIIFIVVVGAGLAGILSVMNTVVKSSADPLIAKQTVAIAESMLEEILSKEYCDPDTVDKTTTPPTCGTHTTEASRALYDDVDDYIGYTTTGGIVDLTGATVAGLTNYNITNLTVAVTTAAQNTALNAIAAKRITVTVTGPQGAVTLIGYRSNY
nr:prepilin-type N-terminal cleavage/methylation domain-containing protein [Rhodoferax sp.]